MRNWEDLKRYCGKQGTQEWQTIRSTSANSSMYLIMTNAYDTRDKTLSNDTSNDVNTQSNLSFTSFGTMFENLSGYVFRLMTGIEYFDLGSVPHSNYPRIRGSVDGYGKSTIMKEHGEEDFILEIKSPYTKTPENSIEKYGYYCQIIQNIEILDADCGIFVNVRNLPATSEDLITEYMAHMARYNKPVECSYVRYGLAQNCSTNPLITVSGVYMAKDAVVEEEDRIILDFSTSNPNFCDLLHYDKKGNYHGNYILPMDETMFGYMIRSRKYEIHPYTFYTKKKIDRIISAPYPFIGNIFMRTDVVNIERIERQKEFWEKDMVPIALRWIEDLDRLDKGDAVIGIHDIPRFTFPENAPKKVKDDAEHLSTMVSIRNF